MRQQNPPIFQALVSNVPEVNWETPKLRGAEMKRLLLSMLLAFAALQPLACMAQTTLFKFNQDGEFASISQSIDQHSSFSLSVSRNFTTGVGTTASLSYTSLTFAPDFSSLTVTQIIGVIPGSAFTGQNIQNLTLSFDTSQLDPNNSFSQTCTIDLSNTAGSACVSAPAGTIQLTFTQNGAQRTRVLAVGEEVTIGNFTERIHQRSDNSSANVSGTIFGATVSGGGATVGINHNTSLEFVRN